MSDITSIEAQIRNYILENFLYTNDEGKLNNDDSFLEDGIVDSTGILELLMFVEETFGIEVADEEGELFFVEFSVGSKSSTNVDTEGPHRFHCLTDVVGCEAAGKVDRDLDLVGGAIGLALVTVALRRLRRG